MIVEALVILVLGSLGQSWVRKITSGRKIFIEHQKNLASFWRSRDSDFAKKSVAQRRWSSKNKRKRWKCRHSSVVSSVPTPAARVWIPNTPSRLFQCVLLKLIFEWEKDENKQKRGRDLSQKSIGIGRRSKYVGRWSRLFGAPKWASKTAMKTFIIGRQ